MNDKFASRIECQAEALITQIWGAKEIYSDTFILFSWFYIFPYNKYINLYASFQHLSLKKPPRHKNVFYLYYIYFIYTNECNLKFILYFWIRLYFFFACCIINWRRNIKRFLLCDDKINECQKSARSLA